MFFQLLQYLKTIKYFGENEHRIKFEDFFQLWSTFLTTFNEVKQEIVQRRRRSLSLDDQVKLRPKPKCLDQSPLVTGTKVKNPKLLSISENSPSLDYDNGQQAVFGHLSGRLGLIVSVFYAFQTNSIA